MLGPHQTRIAICIVLASGCGPAGVVPTNDGPAAVDDGADASSTGSEASGGVGTGPSTSGVSDPPDPTGGGTTGTVDTGQDDASSDSGSAFIEVPDGGTCDGLPPGTLGHCSACDQFLQNCPEGEKCMPWASDGGGVWNATRCSPVVEDPAQVGETCEVEGSAASGLDNCDLGSVCTYLDADTLQGTCVAQCTGSADDPLCPPDTACPSLADGVFSVCLGQCDPLASDCGSNQVCVPISDDFLCAARTSDALADGEACTSINACESGSACVSVGLGGCDADAGCCSSFCDVTLGEPNPACLDPDHVCVPWFEPDTTPRGLDTVGVCGLPQ